MIRNFVFMSCFVFCTMFLLFSSSTVHATVDPGVVLSENFIKSKYPSLASCLDKADASSGPGWSATCGGSIDWLKTTCLDGIPDNDPLWSDCVNDRERSQTIGTCAKEFSKKVCGQIRKTQWNGAVCSEFCMNDSDSQTDLTNKFIAKASVLQCPKLYQKEIAKISDKERDSVVQRLCSPLERDACVKDISNYVAVEVAKNGGDCPLDNISATNKNELSQAVLRRTYDPELFDAPVPEEADITNTIKSVIDVCQKEGGGAYLTASQIECSTFTNCIVNNLTLVDHQDPIFSCVASPLTDRKIRTCSTRFSQAVKNIYLRWLDEIPKDLIDNGINCSGFGNVDRTSMLELISSKIEISDLNPDGLYRQKLIKRKEEGIIDEIDFFRYIVPPVSDGAVDQAFETFNCGFAGTDKSQCCTNELVDLSDEVMRKALDSAGPEADPCLFPISGLPCGIRQSFFVNPILALVMADADEQSGDLQNMLASTGGVPPCFTGTPTGTGSSCQCMPAGAAVMCTEYISNPTVLNDCIRCMSEGDELSYKIYTGIGCIDASMEGVIAYVFSTGLGIAGTIALLCIIYAAFRMQMSQGNPEEVQKSQALITSCISGLMLIIFSVLILRIIGVEVLRLPGFSTYEEFSLTPTVTPVPTGPTATPTNTPIPTPTIAFTPLADFDCINDLPGPREVYVYEDASFQGKCARISLPADMTRREIMLSDLQNTVANSTMSPNGRGGFCRSSFDDCISSLRVGSGVKANLRGEPYDPGAEVASLDGFLNDGTGGTIEVLE